MELPQDLKHYRAPDDPFQIVSPGDAFVALCCVLALAAILK